MTTIYTAVGRFQKRQGAGGLSCPIITVGQREYGVDLQEMILWTILNWRILKAEQLEGLYQEKCLEVNYQANRPFDGCLRRLLQRGLVVSGSGQTDEDAGEAAGIRDALKVPGVVLTLLAFFSYCAGEATCFLWTSSYFAGTKEGLSQELVASFGSLIFGGLMLGRLIAGFVSNRLGDRRLIRVGLAVEAAGILLVLIPGPQYYTAMIGFLMIGTGMGPIYPSIQHMAPANFGKKYSAPVIGLQMASAYIGSTFMPTAFGFIQQYVGIGIMPVYLTVFAVLNFVFLEFAYRAIAKNA